MAQSLIPKRNTTPNRATGHPSAPYEAMSTSQQSHIKELVQHNNDLEKTIKKLRDDLAREITRVRDAEAAGDDRLQKERKDWRDGCDTLQSCHRLAHLRTASLLEAERISVLKEREALRRERVALLQRDFRLSLFQQREAELESQIMEAQEELEEREGNVQDLTEELGQLRASVAEWKAKNKRLAGEVSESQVRKEKLEIEIKQLREAQANATAKSDSHFVKLERLSGQRDKLQARVTELEREVEAAKDANEELNRQHDTWKNLKRDEVASFESLRKKKLQVDGELEATKQKLEEAKTENEEQARIINKLKDRVDKLKEVLGEWKEYAQDNKTTAEIAQERTAALEAEVAELKQQVKKAKIQKPSSKQAEDTQHGRPSDESLPVFEQPNRAKLKPKQKTRKEPGSEDRSELEVAPPPAKVASASKLVKSKNEKTAPADWQDDSRGKEKSDRTVSKKKGLKGKEDGAKAKQIVTKERKGPGNASKADAKKTRPESDTSDVDEQPKKKKRKINIFNAAQTQTFNWDSFTQAGNGLNIPTELSPVKEIPRRLGKISSGLSHVSGR